MKTPTVDNRNNLPVLMLGAIILLALLCIAHHLGYAQDTWLLPNWSLPYAGCSNWCS